MRVWFGGLQRRVIGYMAIVAAIALSSTTLGWGILYIWLATITEREAFFRFGPIDYLGLATSFVLGMGAAIAAAHLLTKRIVGPVSDVTKKARQLASGDFSARAAGVGPELGEIAELVEDFNAMAQRLEVASSQVHQWNATIAHELRTPLTVLTGLLEGVDDGVFETDSHWIAMMRTQTDGLIRLVEDLRVLSLSEGGHFSVRLERSSLDEVLAPVKATFDPLLKQAGFTPAWSLLPVVIVGDPDRIRQAVMALLRNVMTHAVPGPLMVSAVAQGGSAVIAVDDAGPGVPPEAVETLFKPFQRGRTDARGSGLGLAVVSSIIEAHSGAVRVLKSPLGGSRFELVLAREQAD